MILLTAPSGYGKSVLIEQWAELDQRPFRTLILGEEHNDPAMLVASVLGALAPIEGAGEEVASALAVPKPNLEGVVLPRLAKAIEGRRAPFVLVFDDAERIASPESLRVIATLIGAVPPGSQIVIASRSELALGLGRLRAHRRVTEVDREDLAMKEAESDELLSVMGLDLTAAELRTVVERTEGWPAALYLAGLALENGSGRRDEAIARFAGDDRIVVDYLREEFLGLVTASRLEFLLRASVLDRLTGDLCDAVLERHGSAEELRELSRSNMLLTPLDRRDEWFRFHPLFREMLAAELRRGGSEVEDGSQPSRLRLVGREGGLGSGDLPRRRGGSPRPCR